MCGIFGFILKKPLSMNKVFNILKRLETSQYPDEDQPVGGYGAGVAVMLNDGNIISEKVGKTVDVSPVAELASIMKTAKYMGSKLAKAQVLIAHVRFPSSENMGTVKYKEAAQPYLESFEKNLRIVSVHNGNVKNYKELKAKLKPHTFESEKIGPIDSEIIPHYFGEALNELENADAAAYDLISALEGSSAIALLQVDEENALLHLIHKGAARGLIVWTNDKCEVIFCSRPEPVKAELKTLLKTGKFKEKIVINWKEEAGLKLSFPATFA
jgi:glucosamine 6-phosphate synthetase-like amidotransferase/phosphosugar isomerase protein